jgi:hypothetical protein
MTEASAEQKSEESRPAAELLPEAAPALGLRAERMLENRTALVRFKLVGGEWSKT